MKRLRAAFGALVAVATLGGCGVDSDRAPRTIEPDEQPADVVAAGVPTARPGTGSLVYFLGPVGPGESAVLTPVGRAGRADAAALLAALFEGPTAVEQDSLGLRTAVPAGTTLRSAVLDNPGTLVVDVSAELLAGAGDVLRDAVAQIVFTGTELAGVDRIQLLVDGEIQDWPTSAGGSTREPLTVFDFPDRLPFVLPDYPALPSPTVATTSTTTTPARPRPTTTAPASGT